MSLQIHKLKLEYDFENTNTNSWCYDEHKLLTTNMLYNKMMSHIIYNNPVWRLHYTSSSLHKHMLHYYTYFISYISDISEMF